MNWNDLTHKNHLLPRMQIHLQEQHTDSYLTCVSKNETLSLGNRDLI